MVEEKIPRHRLAVIADLLEARVDKIVSKYEQQLAVLNSPLVTEPRAHRQLRTQALAILEDVVKNLRGKEKSPERRSEDRLSETVGIYRAQERVHPSESLRAAAALSEAALSVMLESIPFSPTSRSELAAAALAIQRNIMERVARASVAYGNYLLEKLHEAHVDERKRIGRELHDRVAHSIMVAFRNLELYEMYQEQDFERAQKKLEEAKVASQQALEVTRELSRELRESSTEGNLEVALSDYLRLVTPPHIDARVSAKGDESLIASPVRDQLFLILREAVRNAIVHSGAERIRIELSTTKDRFRAVVQDDGRGFELEEARSTGGTGLASMKERISLLGGAFDVDSGPRDGTKTKLFVPLPTGQT